MACRHRSQYDPVGIVTVTREGGRIRRSAPSSTTRPISVKARVGKQEKYEVLVNPDDVAAGYETPDAVARSGCLGRAGPPHA